MLRSLALKLSEIALKAAFKPLTDAIGSSLAGLVTGAAFAKGGVIQRGMPVPFAEGGVIASPIAFPLAGNRVGIAGERGAEAILPLARGPDGRLGVRADGWRRRPRHLQRHHARRRQLPPLRDPARRAARPRRRPGPAQFVRCHGQSSVVSGEIEGSAQRRTSIIKIEATATLPSGTTDH